MSWYTPTPQSPRFRQLPKVDLHRHLEGAMRLETLMEIVKVHGVTLPLRPDLRSLVQMQPDDALIFSSFLAKFQILRLFYRAPEVIMRVAREAVEDAAADGVQYLDMHFTPAALSRYQGFPLGEVMDWVAASTQEAAARCGMTVRLVASVNRHESVDLAEEVVSCAVERISAGIVALDLAGNEAEYPATPFAPLFREAKAAGLKIAVHAGEWGGAGNVRQALEVLQADRIVHGVRVMEDPQVVALAREYGTPFELCLTSNYQTGVIPTLADHPLRGMLSAGLKITLNTDDPSVSAITLSDEYEAACTQLGLSDAELAGCILNAAEVAFLTPKERESLQARLRLGLAPLLGQ